MNVLNQLIDKNQKFAMYQGDCVETLRGIPDNSIHYSIFSPPFASLYTYSNSERDMGNSSSGEEFQEHFGYLINELSRIIMPGRLVSVHCMNLPAMKSRDGFIGVKDFRGDIIREFVKYGFIFHSEVCIWKNPVTEMQRTKALGLLHKQIRKDSSMCRQGLPDYIVTFRKPGENPEYISHVHESFPVNVWQRYASPVWMDVRQSNTLQRTSARDEKDEKHVCFAPGTLVLTKRGYIPIEDVIVNEDETLTHTGTWKKIIAKKLTKKNVDVVKTNAVGVPNLISTPEHKLYAKKGYGCHIKENLMRVNPDWVEAQNCKDHYLCSKLPPIVESNISETEWWVIGRWLADGHRDARKHQYLVSIGNDKYDEFYEKAHDYIGFTCDRTGCKQIGLINLSNEARDFLSRCGNGASDKKIPYEGISLCKEKSESLLSGYLSGDGCIVNGKIYANSASRSLLLSIAILFRRARSISCPVYAGRAPKISTIEGRTVHCSQEWVLTASPNYGFNLIDGDDEWKKVKSIKPCGKSDVWSIQVDQDASYTAEGCIVKNCPLQLDVIERCINLWTNPGDIVLDPFAGIGSVPYQAVLMGRRGIGVELKDSYYIQAAKNLENAENKVNEFGADTNVRMRCPKCGAKVEEDICPVCGSKIDELYKTIAEESSSTYGDEEYDEEIE